MNTALLLIDVQAGFKEPSWGTRNNPDAEQIMERLLNAWRKNGLPVVHAKHNSIEPASELRAGLPGNDIQAFAKPIDNEVLFEKSVNSCFIGTELEAHLKKHNIEELVVVGLTTDHCVSTTVRMAANLGFKVQLVEDATATFDRENYEGSHVSAEQMHKVNLASLNGEFCTVVSSASVLEGLA